MNLKKWIPWNWFKKEEADAGRSIPVMRAGSQDIGHALGGSIAQFHREIDRLFEQMLRGFDRIPFGSSHPLLPTLDGGMLKPTLDLGATETDYTITVEIPGVDQKDVSLEIAEDTLTIRGEKHREQEDSGKNYYRMERAYGSFQRVLSLPEDVDQERIRASFKNGILTIAMPRKALPEANVRRIEVQHA